ncbi:unnamed protein product [Cylindrotheca closterium]|uniref:Protein FAM136A n=1 Tax=Cylindrotheca closterium TaxID=2856 RepID=A0AAD2GCC7_9STRA|nr:unnamed protein product [Cylindrotheca closterium]
MASASAQSRANALNQKIEAQAGLVLEDIERNYIRKIGRESFACAVKCYDKAGSSGPQEALEQCARNCQVPYQQSAALMQNEVAQFQNRMNRNMQECQEKARDMMYPGIENDARKMTQVEDALVKCMGQQVDEHIKLLKPMKERIVSALKSFK